MIEKLKKRKKKLGKKKYFWTYLKFKKNYFFVDIIKMLYGNGKVFSNFVDIASALHLDG